MKTRTIRQVVTVRGGGTPAKSNASYYGGDIPWVTPKDMKRATIESSEIALTEEGVKRSPAKIVPADSVLVVVRSGVLKHTLPVARTTVPVAVNQDVKALVPREGLEARYLLRLVKSLEPRVLSWVRATTADNFPIDNLLDVEIMLPEMDEQRRTVAILDAADAIRVKRRQMLAHLDTLNRAVFTAMFGNPLLGRDMRTLGEVSRIIRGASPRPAGDPRYFGGDFPWLKISDVTSTTGPVVHSIRETVTEAGRKRSVYLPPGTLILTNSATVGVAKIVEPATCIHDGFLAFLDIVDSVDVVWLQATLTAIRNHLVRLAPEGTQKNLNGPIVKAVEVSIPSMHAQREYVEKAAAINSQRATVERALTLDDELFASLQHRAFRGEL